MMTGTFVIPGLELALLAGGFGRVANRQHLKFMFSRVSRPVRNISGKGLSA